MIEFSISGETPSTPNLREHWAAKAKRTKAQRSTVARKMPAWTEGPLLIVRLTRVAPRSLDTDNLAAALKGHRDAVAARLRVDDASPLVRWEYHQAKGSAAVVVNAWRAGERAPEYLKAGPVTGSIRAPRPHGDDRRPKAGDAARARAEGRKRLGMGHAIEPLTNDASSIKARANYTPPRTKPVAHRSDCEQAYHKDDREPCTCGALDAANEAEETFAPPPKRLPCLDPDKMNGAGDQFPGSDYD